jgi:hypothetical protein
LIYVDVIDVHVYSWCELLFAVDHVELISDYLKHGLGTGSNSGLIITPGSGHQAAAAHCLHLFHARLPFVSSV